MKLWTILVPTVRPDGRPIRARYHRVWDAKVRAIANGLTVLKPAVGQWIAKDGELFVERMIPVLIACSEEQINTIADLTAKYYDQKAIAFWETSSNFVIKHYGS